MGEGFDCCPKQYSVYLLLWTDKAALKEENRRLRAELVCRRCQLVKVETLFLPCRHLVACQQCADAMHDCIKCRQKILGTVRTYLL